MNPLGAEVPEGWIVTGHPWDTLDTAPHRSFRKAYEAWFDEPPRMGSVVGYTSLHALAKAIEAAGSTDSDAVAEALRGMEIDSPFGRIRFRTQINSPQSGPSSAKPPSKATAAPLLIGNTGTAPNIFRRPTKSNSGVPTANRLHFTTKIATFTGRAVASTARQRHVMGRSGRKLPVKDARPFT